jgi:geranylgeranyl diphosphate synthase type I
MDSKIDVTSQQAPLDGSYEYPLVADLRDWPVPYHIAFRPDRLDGEIDIRKSVGQETDYQLCLPQSEPAAPGPQLDLHAHSLFLHLRIVPSRLQRSMTATCLQQLQSRFGDAIDREVRRWLSLAARSPDFSGMMAYQLGYVDRHFHPISSGTGKLFRPLLCLLACEAVGGRWEDALPVGAGVELLHNFSLVHDDIEDRDPARRHRPTVWKVWGEPEAINVGDGMFALANRAILGALSGPHITLEVARAFQDTSLALTKGQYLDMSFETRETVSAEEYLYMITLKTGALIAFSAWSGASMGGAEETTRTALREFGHNLGKAFQIRDDIMGVWGSPDVTGKVAAKDLQNRKKTLPVLLAGTHSSIDQRRVLHDFFARKSDDVEPVLRVLDEIDARGIAQQRAKSLLDSALLALSQADIPATSRDQLGALARELSDQ